jgi:hypothetical protein
MQKLLFPFYRFNGNGIADGWMDGWSFWSVVEFGLASGRLEVWIHGFARSKATVSEVAGHHFQTQAHPHRLASDGSI